MTFATHKPQMDLFAKNPPPARRQPAVVTQPATTCHKCLETFLSDHEVAARYGVSRAAIWRWVKGNPDFPGPLKLSPGTTRWKLTGLVRFEAAREQSKTTPPRSTSSGDQS